jgi:hypothetical protein
MITGGLENLVPYAVYITDKHKGRPIIQRHRENLIRISRVIVRLIFGAARGVGGEDNLDDIKRQGLLESEEEYRLLAHATVPTRPHIALMWFWRIFDQLQADGVHITDEGKWWIQTNVTNVRTGIQNTLALVECPFPFTLAHIMHWIVQMYIWILAIETGVGFAIQLQRTGNGLCVTEILYFG